MSAPGPLPPFSFGSRTRTGLGILVFCAAAALLGLAALLPFYLPSSSLLYKFGWEKTLLLSGKAIGIVTAGLVFFQVVLIARFRLLDHIFGLDRLVRFHRVSGAVILLAGLAHPVLVMASEGMWMIPLETRYWPEWTGAMTLVMVAGLVVSALFRNALNIPFHWWRRLHQCTAWTAICLLFGHVLTVSETFELAGPRLGTLVLAAALLALFMAIRAAGVGFGTWPYTVSAVTPAGKNAVLIVLAPVLPEKPLAFHPGQFGFFTFSSAAVTGEAHPFTIASSPSQTGQIDLVVRTTGDWTRRLMHLSPGDRCRIDGPYGLFSFQTLQPDGPMVMIAGGIGITPMLSMLRHMADRRRLAAQPDINITLIWTNRTRKHRVCPDIFEFLEQNLEGLTIHHIFTRDPEAGTRRINPPFLARLLEQTPDHAHFYLCGPAPMMAQIRRMLKETGISSSRIHTEHFFF